MRQKSISRSRSASRGAPRGNKNALKHGFYSRELDLTDLDGFKNLDPLSLDNEIILMRVMVRRLVASSRGVTDFDRLSSLMRTLTFASLSLTRLMRTRYLIQGKSSMLSNEVDEAIHLWQPSLSPEPLHLHPQSRPLLTRNQRLLPRSRLPHPGSYPLLS